MKLYRSVCTICLLLVISAHPLLAHDDDGKGIGNSAPPGIGGWGPWDSFNMTLLSRLPLDQIGGGPANVIGADCWGWTDSLTGSEYAIFCLTNKTSFIDITDPVNPVYLGSLPTETGNRAWRDAKIYADHAFIVADNNGAHGMQIFDLTQLRTAQAGAPHTFSNTAHFAGFEEAHNIAINEQSGYAYIVGSEMANGGLYVLDISVPTVPVHVGDFSADGYTHDCQVVTYAGPDLDYAGSEVAFNCNADTLTIVDVTDKSNMTQISRTGYPNRGYTHQGWLSEDHRYFFMNDELDEWNGGGKLQTMTRVWNVEDLDNPFIVNVHDGTQQTIDHNLYTKDGYVYQANYTSGLRVLKVVDAVTGELAEVAYFDTYNTDNALSFNGAWSVFPYFDSGNIIISDRQNGLFVVSMGNTVGVQTLDLQAGQYMSGAASDLQKSDDQYLVHNGQFLANRYQFRFNLDGVAVTETPSDLSFTFESSTINFVGNVERTIELYNYDTGQYELFDSRVASAPDSVTLIEPTGDLSRFVETGTCRVQARITYEHGVPWYVFDFFSLFLPFQTKVDQVVWEITP